MRRFSIQSWGQKYFLPYLYELAPGSVLLAVVNLKKIKLKIILKILLSLSPVYTRGTQTRHEIAAKEIEPTLLENIFRTAKEQGINFSFP